MAFLKVNIHTLLLYAVMCVQFSTISAQGGSSVSSSHTCIMMEMQVERLPDLHHPRSTGIKFRIGDEVVVAGGHTDGFIPTATAEYFKDGEWHEIPMVYSHDDGLFLVLRSGKVLIAGGHEQHLGIGQTFPAEIYDASTHRFEGFGCLDQKRALANAVEIDSGKVVIAGNHYNEDYIECFDGKKEFRYEKALLHAYTSPFLFRTSKDNVMIFGCLNPKANKFHTYCAEQLHGDTIPVPLFKNWQPLTLLDCYQSDDSFIGDEQKGIYSYLFPVENDSGQIAIAKTIGTEISLLQTTSPVPMKSPFGTVITYNSHVIVDRSRQRGYIYGADGQHRHYVLCIEYGTPDKNNLIPLSLYYSKPLPESGASIPILTADGDLMVIGGIQDSNFKPFQSVYLFHTGTLLSAEVAGFRWWLAGIIALAAGLGLWLWARRLRHKDTPSSTPLPDSATMPSCPALPSQDNTLAEESALILQIRDLMERDHLYLQSELKISDVANALGTNSRYVSESIRNYEGCTFIQFINRYRVEHAEQILLKTPDKKVSAVSEESGFSNETTFFRTFKAIKGMTPREWLSSQKLDKAEE